MLGLVEALKAHFAEDPTVYVSGNLFVFHEEGDGRKHLAPDVFVVSGVPERPGDNSLIWEEGKGPDVVIELTPKTTRAEDETKKFARYRDVLKVPEYFLSDPFEESLRPSAQGYRLRQGRYAAIEQPVLGRIPGEALGLHLERSGTELRLFDPATGRRLPTPGERATASLADQ